MKTLVVIIICIVLLVASGVGSYEIIKWRDHETCNSSEVETLRREVDGLKVINTENLSAYNKIKANLELYTKYRQYADNLQAAMVRQP